MIFKLYFLPPVFTIRDSHDRAAFRLATALFIFLYRTAFGSMVKTRCNRCAHPEAAPTGHNVLLYNQHRVPFLPEQSARVFYY
jgi:hypothetical protein